MYSIFTDNLGKLVNIDLYNLFKNSNYKEIYITGFAKDICVAFTVKDLLEIIEKERVIILEDCMSTLDMNSENLKIYNDLTKQNVNL